MFNSLNFILYLLRLILIHSWANNKNQLFKQDKGKCPYGGW